MTISPIAFNPTIAAKQRGLQSNLQRTLLDLLNHRNQLNTDYASQSGSLSANQPNIYRNVLNRAAGRGMAYSSGYGEQRAGADANFAQQMSALSAIKNAGLANDDVTQTRAQEDFQYGLSNLADEAAALQAQDHTLTGALAGYHGTTPGTLPGGTPVGNVPPSTQHVPPGVVPGTVPLPTQHLPVPNTSVGLPQGTQPVTSAPGIPTVGAPLPVVQHPGAVTTVGALPALNALTSNVTTPVPHVNTPTPTVAAKKTVAAKPPVLMTPMYTIKKGDTLSAIAARNHTTVAALVKLNKITNPNLITIGRQLKVR